jgi:predicted HNH restriction endonuclease
MRSRERAAALKASGYCCEKCNVKQSKAKGREQKIVVHHKHGIDWEGIIDLIFERVLIAEYEVLCPDCHDKEHIVKEILNG